MLTPLYAWPNVLELATITLGLLALVASLLAGKLPAGMIVAPCLTLCFTACWIAYEARIQEMAEPGDPLIRIDLLLIVPLWLACWITILLWIGIKQMAKP